MRRHLRLVDPETEDQAQQDERQRAEDLLFDLRAELAVAWLHRELDPGQVEELVRFCRRRLGVRV